MNWYKISKMIDVGDGIATYLYCPTCKRFAVEKDGETLWVPYYQMNSYEQMQMNEAKEKFEQRKSTLSPQVCPDCKNK